MLLADEFAVNVPATTSVWLIISLLTDVVVPTTVKLPMIVVLPPTYKLACVLIPPVTCNAPVVVLDACVEFVN